MSVDVTMPQLGESVTEGTVGRWLKQPGEPILKYEPLLEVTTDKVDTEVPATVDGTVLELLVAEGETVRVGTIIARLDPTAAVDQTNSGSALPAATLPASPVAGAGAPPISPVVARLASEHRLDLAQIQGTGSNGRVTKKDVEQHLASGRPQPQPQGVVSSPNNLPAVAETIPEQDQALQETMSSGPAGGAPAEPSDVVAAPPRPAPAPGDELVALSPMRRAIAEHMVRSKRTAPHVTTVMEVDLARMTLHRARVKADYERQGARLTFTAYFVQAAVAALRAVPLVNASYRDDGILMHSRINIGVAVAIPDGLIVPVIKDADDRSLLGLARAVNDLAERARARRLQPDETQEGTFTITNHGVSGSLFAMPIINQPQAAILGIGAIEKRAVVVTEHGLDAIAIRPRAYLSLTFDHRVMDGAAADEFLCVFKSALEEYAD